MNFFAMPRLKNDRSVVAFFISMMRRFGLNSTFDSARTGMSSEGSFFFLADSTTMSAKPTSRSSTLSFAMTLLLFLRLLALILGSLGGTLLFLRHLGGAGSGVVDRIHAGRLRHRAQRTLERDDDGRLARGLLFGGFLLQDLIGLFPAGNVLGDLRQALLEVLGVELALLQPLAVVGHFLDGGLEHVAPLQLQGRALALADERAQPPAGLVHREADLLADLVIVSDGLLRLAGERHPDGAPVDADDG